MKPFYFPVRIISGKGCLRGLVAEIERLRVRRPLIVTDPGIIAAGIVDRVLGLLHRAGYLADIFDGVIPNPEIRQIANASNYIQSKGADLLIAIGGGSVIDAAKAAAILATSDIDIREYQGPRESYPNRPLPVITVSTTAGSGSEVSSAAIIVDREKEYKMYFKSPEIFARSAFLDADVLVGVPSDIAAVAGADTLTHAVESFFNPYRSFITEAASLRSLKIVMSHLLPFVRDTRNIEHAQEMMAASSLAGIAMTTAGLGLVHALAHPVGVLSGISHGQACGMLLPVVMSFNSRSVSEQFVRLADCLQASILPAGTAHEKKVDRTIHAIGQLLAKIGISSAAPDIAVPQKHLDRIITEAHDSFLNEMNPSKASHEDIRRIILEVFDVS
jgi:alcohol dehydrogenase class IV